MNLRSCLLALLATLLLTSCASSPAPMPSFSRPVPAACRIPCYDPPVPSNPRWGYEFQLLRWSRYCQDLHAECVTGMQTE